MCKRLGIVNPTFFRDESASALTKENGRNYMAMVRKAIDISGASLVLLITHDPDLQDLADSRILVEDGTVKIAGPMEIAGRRVGLSLEA